jgi:hypothetical protein
LLVLALAGSSPKPLVGQAEVPSDTVVLQGVMRAPFQDTLDVFLSKRVVYVMTISPGSAVVVLKPLSRYGRAAFTVPLPERNDPGHAALEVHTYESGIHHLTITAPASVDSVQFSIWTDQVTTARIIAAEERQWGIGPTLGVGYHTGYRITAGDPSPLPASAAFEGGLMVGTSGRFGGVLGVGWDPRARGSNHVTWVFAEPRVRFYEWPRIRRVLDVELTARIAQGNSRPRILDPSQLAAGLLVAYHLDRRPGSRGLRVGLQVQHGRLGNIGGFTGTQFTSVSFSTSWLP